MEFLQVMAYIFGAVFICICIAVLVINIIGIVKDIKKKKNNKRKE